jgi:hypothetical protein
MKSPPGAAGFVVGLGVRAVRAGSIGRDEQRFGESPETPISKGEGLDPRPVYKETGALIPIPPWRDRTPRPGHLLVFTPDLNPLRLPTRYGRVTPRGVSLLTKFFILVIMRLPLISSEKLFLGFKIQAFSKEVLVTQTAESGRQFSD